jgi:hypothetical protein
LNRSYDYISWMALFLRAFAPISPANNPLSRKIVVITHTYRVMEDLFRPIEGYPGYRVSKEGEVESRWSRSGRRTLAGAWRPLKPIRRGRYLTVNISDGVKKVARCIHRLVLEAFVGLRPTGLVCCHNDGDPTNNRLSNLRWDTYLANEHDKVRHGTKRMGEELDAKLTEGGVAEIRRLRSEGMRFTELADRFGVTSQNVQAVVHRRTWKHLP